MKSGVLIKKHKSVDKEIVALADKELIGKTFEEGDLCLKVTERFYDGDEKTEEEIIKEIKKATNLNIVGEKAIKIAVKAKVITKDSIVKIQRVPHAISIKYGI